MSTFGDLAPDRIWWCHVCSGGVGVWGLDNDKPPPRCPSCHAADTAHVKFVPENAEFMLHLIDHVWSVAHEDDSVPASSWAKAMLEAARSTYVMKKRLEGR